MFVLRMHGFCDGQNENHAVELLAETVSESVAEAAEAPPSQSKLAGLTTAPIQSQHTNYSEVGTLVFPGRTSPAHRIFYTDERFWYETNDLERVLQTDDFRNRLRPTQRIQLASLIAITHLHFANIRVSYTELGPSNFFYYNKTDEATPWVDSEPFVLNPYLSIGFGNCKPSRSFGGSSGLTPQMNNIVAELGLLLHQIGSSSRIEYGSGSYRFHKAKNEALHSLHRVDFGAGGWYAEVVQMCLEWKPPWRYRAGEGDTRVIQRVVAWLAEFREKLEEP
ncbi:hypothetical protein BDW02DRAFT_246344 [Decorospora gaudefroyi]|uniref:Uncharacterized protein n=1 Tax=Decorospora gaudefroyi TaxID=184978 RepID=A0A6A5K1P2_9PLEO|nr:hypothetical protein BDW02DRAFT_246344 [Decorospora gaudefroyi]